MFGMRPSNALCVQFVVASVLTPSASLLHGLTQKADPHTPWELRHGANASAVTLKKAKVQTQQAKDYFAPRMFVVEGCDGSTALMQHAIRILKLHGMNAGQDNAQKELLDKSRNPYITASNDDIVKAMEELKEEHKSKGKTLVFKSILHRDKDATVKNGLKNLGTYAVYSTRRNTVDHLACMVRDCFLNSDVKTTQYGYPVDSNGNPSGVCFDRRHTSDNDKAYLKVSELAKNLKEFEDQVTDGVQTLKNAGYDAAHLIMEDMIAFEAHANNIDKSMDAWRTLLKSWNIEPDDVELRKYLSSYAGTWAEPSQKEAVFNIVEVKDELRRLGREDLIRWN